MGGPPGPWGREKQKLLCRFRVLSGRGVGCAPAAAGLRSVTAAGGLRPWQGWGLVPQQRAASGALL